MKLLRITILALIGLMFISMQCLAKSAEEGGQSFSVTFEQDGKVVKPSGHVINLQKKEFAVSVTFLGYQGEPVAVRLNTSINDTYYKVASNGLQVSDLLADGIGMAEPVDVQKSLILTDTKAIQYLFIDTNGSRFHDVKTRDDVISGKRYITELNFRGAKSFPIQDLPVNEVYMVFIKRSSTGVQQEYYLIQFPKPEFPKQTLTAAQWLLQGMKYEQLKDFGLAIEAYSGALAINNSQYNLQAYLKRGVASAKIGRFNQALTDSNTALTIRPDNIDAYSLRAYVLTAVGSRAQAIEDYSKVIDLNPNLSFAYWQRAMLVYNEKSRFSLKRETLQAALEDFSKVIELEPNNAAAFKNRADIYHVLKEYNKALDDYNKAISLIPNNISYYEGRRLTYSAIASTGKDTSEESWENYNKIIEIDHRNADAYYGRAIMGNKLAKDFGLVKADLQTATTLYFEKAKNNDNKSNFPLMADINNFLMSKGEILRAHGYFDEALEVYLSILKYKPDFIRYLYHYTGVVHFEKGEYDKAIEDCTKAIELTNWSWDYIVRGRAYKAKGMLEEAKSDFSKALSLQPNLEEARTELNSL